MGSMSLMHAPSAAVWTRQVNAPGLVVPLNKDMRSRRELYSDVVVDLETLGTGDDAQVVSIGAVRIRLDGRDDLETIREPARCFYRVLDRVDQMRRGRSINADTQEWWDSQSEEAREVFDEPGEDPTVVLEDFAEYCGGAKRMWGNGNMFDNAILRSLFNDYEMEYPFKFWSDLDMRTLTYLWNKLTGWVSKGKRPDIHVGVAHNALDDAQTEALQMQKMYQDLEDKTYGT